MYINTTHTSGMSPTSRLSADERRSEGVTRRPTASPASAIGGRGSGAINAPSGAATYKEYAYSPVPTSPIASSVYQPTTQPSSASDEEEQQLARIAQSKPRPSGRAELLLEMEESGSKVLQYVAAVSANLVILAGGAMMGWTSPVTANLEKEIVQPDNPLGIPITKDESSWIGSIMALGAVAGSLVAGFLGEKFGRKKSLLFSVVPYLIGWALVATASSIAQLYIARFIFGIALSISFTIVPMYCGEIAETSIRGVLGSFLQLFVTVGLLYAYAIGPYVTYTIFWITCAVLPVVFFVVFTFMPESPYYLLSEGKKSEATDSLARLRGKSTSAVQKELGDMQVAVDQAYSTEVKLSDLFTVKANFKALLYTCAAVSFQQLTGINVVLFYAQTIFKDTGSSLPPAISTIIIGVVQVGASAVTPVVVDRMGRRTLLLASGVGTAIGTAALGLFFYIKAEGSDVSNLGWLPVTSLVVFMCLYCIGWGPLPWAIMGEMFSAEVKAKASGITVLVCWALAFVITKYFSGVADAWGMHVAFWIFTVCCIVSVAFVIVLLPETRGKSLRQIQDELGGLRSAERRDGDATDAPGKE
ncbi:facilitated trehalose transporter Tret1-2 homolog [Copidosoma floridanum]|uniref:facilitated trehalose transporter Tret1-2 homolog n=1 Tax=Copidosoma floridanum TaxID=29053 RepID=UPI0006C9C5D0|nr:facilitated trehalose transporter Tret1-2 homolog [Copidosoma floridanum]